LPERGAVLNGGVVKAYSFQFLPAAKGPIFIKFPQKCALQKVS
jgi:hypothetical protein